MACKWQYIGQIAYGRKKAQPWRWMLLRLDGTADSRYPANERDAAGQAEHGQQVRRLRHSHPSVAFPPDHSYSSVIHAIAELFYF